MQKQIKRLYSLFDVSMFMNAGSIGPQGVVYILPLHVPNIDIIADQDRTGTSSGGVCLRNQFHYRFLGE